MKSLLLVFQLFFVFQFAVVAQKANNTGFKKLPDAATASWEDKARDYISGSEYYFRAFDKTYATANRKQRISFTATGAGLVTKPIQFDPANTSKQTWSSSLVLQGISKSSAGGRIGDEAKVTSSGNHLLFTYPGFAIEYLNDEKGLRQNFLIDTKPAGDEKLQVSLKIAGDLVPSVSNHKTLLLADKQSKKTILQYDDLKVWDANKRLLPASMELRNDELVFIVDDADAVYPVTVDPLTHAAEWITSADGVLPGILNTLQLQVDALYGYTVAALGDINDDGFDDIAIGAPGAIDIIAGPTTVAGAGAVFVYFGSATGPSTTPDKVLRATTPIANALFGFSVAGGNVTATVPGNQRNDIIVGAPGESYSTAVSGLPATATVTAGKVYVFSGETMSGVGNPSPLLSVFLQGSTYFSNGVLGVLSANVTVNALFGFSVAATEDMNGDNLGEVIIGAPGYAAPGLLPLLPVRIGTALVYYSTNLGSNTATQLVAPTASLLGIPLLTNGLLFGYSVDGLGDYDKDGRPDVVVGAPAGLNLVPPTNLLGGTAYIYKGTGTGVNTTHYAYLRDTASLINNIANLFGYTVRGVRNANGVRNGNVLVGSPAGNVLSNLLGGLRLKTGTVNVFLATSDAPASGGEIPDQSFSSPRGNALLSILGGQNLSVAALFGASIDNMLDVNCDGINDIIVGEPLSTGVGLINTNAVGGAVNIFLGKADGTYQTSSFWSLQNNTDLPFGINAGSLLGYSVAGARHVRGQSNGVRALVGAPGAALDFSTGLFNLGGTFGTLFGFVAGNNGLGKSYLYGFDDCGLMLNPDLNETWVNVPVPGNVSTNDAVPALTSYGTPTPNIGNPAGGSITMNASGTYTFTSTTAGVFYYQVPVCILGQSQPCPTTGLKITVLDGTLLNNPPVANTDIATTRAGNPVTLRSLANDKCSNAGCSLNPASVTVTVNPANGTTSVDAGTGNITYTPNPGFTGKDTLTYQVCDNIPVCATAQQVITVNATGAVNSTNAADDYVFTQKGSPVNGDVKANDTDPENDTQTVTAQNTTIPAKGTLVLDTDGSFNFVPDPGFSGPVDFPYNTCDNGSPQACAQATLHILVSNNGTLLPITLSNFAVSSKNCVVYVQWNYSNQVYGDYTELEQSSNGIAFTAVHRINFSGQASGSHTVKLAQLQGSGYYRLKITDNTGKFRYSEVKFVQTSCGEQQKLQVFPTIITAAADVVFTTTEAKGMASVAITDIHGRRLITEQVTIVKGINRISINSARLSPGSYFVRIEGKDWKSETIKVIKE